MGIIHVTETQRGSCDSHLITVEDGRAVRMASGRPKPKKYGQFFSMRAILW